MLQHGLPGVELIVANTDWHSLYRSAIPAKMQLGDSGLARGGDPLIGWAAALRSSAAIRDRLKDSNGAECRRSSRRRTAQAQERRIVTACLPKL